ncbi:MAG: PEP-CTERM sorting domain-containing protein [Verrucomicrobiota bacterium]|nr:PEP-CTERM sorting domain-containing protein [Verrucomicrobiota bacterium]
MKKTLIALVAVLVSLSTYGQGSVFFSTRDTAAGIDAKVVRAAGTVGAGLGAGGTVGPAITAQLFLVGAGGSLTPLTPATTFRTTGSAANHFYINATDVVVPGIAAGQSATFRFRAYETAAGSYDAAANSTTFQFGESNDVTVSALGGTPVGGGAPITTPTLVGLQGFTLTIVPEPGTIALGVLGGLALLARRRK